MIAGRGIDSFSFDAPISRGLISIPSSTARAATTAADAYHHGLTITATLKLESGVDGLM